MRRAAQHFGYTHRDIVSGAGHDACYLARVTPTSMIFTPCVDGVSHNESEDIKLEWSTAGANVLMHAVLEKAEIVGLTGHKEELAPCPSSSKAERSSRPIAATPPTC